MLRLLIRTVVWLVRAVFRSRDDLILDWDGKYGSLVPYTLRVWGVKLVVISPRSPRQSRTVSLSDGCCPSAARSSTTSW